MNPKIDAYISKARQWREETAALRPILLGCGLTEDLKWGKPCYAFQDSNVVIIQGFKKYCALLFFKGVLLKDPNGILKKTGPNTVVGRQIRFTKLSEIIKMKSILKAYINQAIEVEKAGLTTDRIVKETKIEIPEEFQNKIDGNRALKAAFEGLTPGRQKAYIFYFSAPKQSQTRLARIKKCLPQILKGKGLNDDYIAQKNK
jgi:uncharacterized protein YdeI (YjbR/CyaY-like superfamily)